MALSIKQALTSFAEMMNTGNSASFEALLSDNFHYASQTVFEELKSKDEFVAYMRQKLKSIKSSGSKVFAELGELHAYGKNECVVIAQGNKDNVLATVFLTISGDQVTRADMCTVPPPHLAKRSGLYPGLEGDSQQKTFISYATTYDGYVGKKNWNELKLEERRAIVECEFAGKELDIEPFIMSTGLKKLQAQGLRSLFVYSQMLNERMGLIKPNKQGDNDLHYILSIFANTKIFHEITELLKGQASEKTIYDGKELEALAQTNSRPSPLDATLDMTSAEAARFILGKLELLGVDSAAAPFTKNVEVKREDQPVDQNKKINFVRKNRGWNWNDLLVCSEVKWIRAAIRDFFDSNDYLIKNQALKECLRAGSDSDKAKYSIRVDRMKPEQVALIIIRNVAQNKLVYGDHHVYRGVLSITGKEYKKIFYDAVTLYAKLGFGNEAEAKQELSEITKAISEVG